MTPKQKAYKENLIKQIHISRRYQEYFKENRDDYVDLLQEHFGVSGSKELEIDQLKTVADFMCFKTVKLPTAKISNPDAATPKQVNTIRSIWENYADDKSDEALLRFIHRQTKKRYLHVKNMTLREAQVLITVLLRMQSQK